MSGSDVPQTRVGGRWRIDTGGREAGFVTDMPLQPPLRGYSARHRLTNSAERPDNFDEGMMSLLYEANKEGRAEGSNARSEEIARISPPGIKGYRTSGRPQEVLTAFITKELRTEPRLSMAPNVLMRKSL